MQLQVNYWASGLRVYFALTILSPMSSQAPNDIHKPFQRPGASERRCQVLGCSEEGAYRAPVARDRLDQYYWFCLEHIRAYNGAWDYFAGLSEQEIEFCRREDAVWGRPTWPLSGAGAEQRLRTEEQLREEFEAFKDARRDTGGQAAKPQPRNDRERALDVLGLGFRATFDMVRARYRELAKKLHPDANGGCPVAEDRLKDVNQAYAVLKGSFNHTQRDRA